MAEKITLSGRVTKETEERFDRFRKERDLSKSDALRRLLDAGLESIEEKPTETEVSAWTPFEERALNYLEVSVALWLVSGASGLAVLLVEVILGLSGFVENTAILVFGICVGIFLISSASAILFGGILSLGLASGIEEVFAGIRTPD